MSRREVLKIGLIVVLVLVVAPVGLAAGIGALLPPDHQVTRSVDLDHPPGEVWALISDFESMPEWMPHVQEMERGEDRDGNPVWIETNEYGTVPYEVAGQRPPHDQVLRIVGEDVPFRGTWSQVIEPLEDGGCRLVVTEDGWIPNPIFRFVGRFVHGYDATVEMYLGAVEEELDARE